MPEETDTQLPKHEDVALHPPGSPAHRADRVNKAASVRQVIHLVPKDEAAMRRQREVVSAPVLGGRLITKLASAAAQISGTHRECLGGGFDGIG